MADRALRELVAEYELLRRYNEKRQFVGHDFGCGARYAELARRRREIEALAGIETVLLDFADLVAAWSRVGEPRYRRAQVDGEKYGSPGAVRTAETWRGMKALYAREGVTT